MTRRRKDAAPAYCSLARAILLASFILGCASVAHGQTVAQRAKIRGDSILAVAKCWRAVRPLPAGTTLSPCPDSLEAARVAAMSPLARATSGGVLMLMMQGDTLSIRAVAIHGYVFVGPAHGAGLGVMHTDALLTAGNPGPVPITLTLNGLVGRAALIVIARPDRRLAELPRFYLDASMPAMPLSGDTIFVGPPGTPLRCSHLGATVPCSSLP
jgi:hypothetical protein